MTTGMSLTLASSSSSNHRVSPDSKDGLPGKAKNLVVRVFIVVHYLHFSK